MSIPLPMKNIGATCHTNVVMQTLLSCGDFNKANLIYGRPTLYKTLYKAFLVKDQVVFNNVLLKLKNQLSLINGQQDAHETLNKIFDYIAPENKKASKYFIGKNTTEYLCKNCYHSLSKNETFKEIVLSINNCNTLEECLNKYYSVEQLLDYTCDVCKSNNVIKRAFLTLEPKYIFFVLNRFNKNSVSVTKNNRPVNYSSGLNLTFARLFNDDRKLTYKLKAVVNHTGTVKSGHYYSYNTYDFKNWYKCDDMKISKIPNDVSSKTAYILLYERN